MMKNCENHVKFQINNRKLSRSIIKWFWMMKLQLVRIPRKSVWQMPQSGLTRNSSNGRKAKSWEFIVFFLIMVFFFFFTAPRTILTKICLALLWPVPSHWSQLCRFQRCSRWVHCTQKSINYEIYLFQTNYDWKWHLNARNYVLKCWLVVYAYIEFLFTLTQKF